MAEASDKKQGTDKLDAKKELKFWSNLEKALTHMAEAAKLSGFVDFTPEKDKAMSESAKTALDSFNKTLEAVAKDVPVLIELIKLINAAEPSKAFVDEMLNGLMSVTDSSNGTDEDIHIENMDYEELSSSLAVVFGMALSPDNEVESNSDDKDAMLVVFEFITVLNEHIQAINLNRCPIPNKVAMAEK